MCLENENYQRRKNVRGRYIKGKFSATDGTTRNYDTKKYQSHTCSGQQVLERPQKSLTDKHGAWQPCRGSTREADDLESLEWACHAQVALRTTESFPG